MLSKPLKYLINYDSSWLSKHFSSNFWVIGGQLSQYFALRNSVLLRNKNKSLIFSSVRENSNFHTFLLDDQNRTSAFLQQRHPVKMHMIRNKNAPSEYVWTHSARIIVARQHWHPVLWSMFIKVRKFIIFSSLTPNILKMNYHCNEKLIIRKTKFKDEKIGISTEFLFLSLWVQKNKGNW